MMGDMSIKRAATRSYALSLSSLFLFSALLFSAEKFIATELMQ